MAMDIIRPRRSRSVAAYSRQTFPWTMCRSVCRSVCQSSALWKNGGSDPDAVRHRRSNGSRDETGSVVWGSVHGNGYFWGRICSSPLSTGTYRGQGVRVLQRRDAALLPNYFGQTCYTYHRVIWTVWTKFSSLFLSPMLQWDRDGNDSSGNGTGSGTTYQTRAKLYTEVKQAMKYELTDRQPGMVQTSVQWVLLQETFCLHDESASSDWPAYTSQCDRHHCH